VDRVEITAIRRLAAAIIHRALLDLRSANSYYRKTAEEFLLSSYCELMCEALGINYHKLLRKARKIRKTVRGYHDGKGIQKATRFNN